MADDPRDVGQARPRWEFETAVDLTDMEANALARRLVARHLAADADSGWLLWEDYPMLAEMAFLRLSEAVDAHVNALARDASKAASDGDRRDDIDSMFLLERTQ